MLKKGQSLIYHARKKSCVILNENGTTASYPISFTITDKLHFYQFIGIISEVTGVSRKQEGIIELREGSWRCDF